MPRTGLLTPSRWWKISCGWGHKLPLIENHLFKEGVAGVWPLPWAWCRSHLGLWDPCRILVTSSCLYDSFCSRNPQASLNTRAKPLWDYSLPSLKIAAVIRRCSPLLGARGPAWPGTHGAPPCVAWALAVLVLRRFLFRLHRTWSSFLPFLCFSTLVYLSKVVLHFFHVFF